MQDTDKIHDSKYGWKLMKDLNAWLLWYKLATSNMLLSDTQDGRDLLEHSSC